MFDLFFFYKLAEHAYLSRIWNLHHFKNKRSITMTDDAETLTLTKINKDHLVVVLYS